MDLIFNGLKYYLIFFLIVFVIALTGYCIYRVFINRTKSASSKSTLFYALLTGVVFYVTVFSLIATSLRSINLVFVLLFVFFYFESRHKRHHTLTGFPKDMLLFIKSHALTLLWVALPFYLYEAIWLFDFSTGKLIIPFVDYIDMYNVSQVISLSGEENNKFLLSNFYFSEFRGMAPYHFFELWLNGLLKMVTTLPGVLTLMLFVYPFFYLTSYLGVLSLWEHYGTVTPVKKIITFLLLFTGGMYFSFYKNNELLQWYGGVVGNIAHIWGKKAAVLYPFVIAAYLAFIKGQFNKSTILLLSLGLVSIGVMPGITGGLVLFLFVLLVWRKISFKTYKLSLLIIPLFAVFFVLLYAIFGNKNSDSLGFSKIISDFLGALDSSFIKTLFFRIVFPVLRLAIIYSPFLIFVVYVLFFTAKSDKILALRRLSFLLILILGIGAVTGAVASINLFSGGQFFNYLFPLLIVFIILVFVYFYSQFDQWFPKKKIVAATVFMLVFVLSSCYNLYNNFVLEIHYKRNTEAMYGRGYLDKVTDYLDTSGINPLGVCFMGPEDIEHYPLNSYGVTGLTFSGMSVKLTKQFSAVSNLSIFDLGVDTTEGFSKQLFKSFEFYNFVKTLKKEDSFVDTENAQIAFTETFNIDYALVYKHGICPEALEEQISYELKDSVSGQRFLVFKND